MGQLLEYAYRPPAIRPDRLIVAGEPPIDPETERYLGLLQSELLIPIRYLRIKVPD